MARPTGNLLAGRYRTIKRLGSGGMATVLLAEDERLGRQVAVKRMHAESPDEIAKRFQREAQLGAALNHPNIVSIFDIETDDENVLIVMEYVSGGTLKHALSRGPLPRPAALRVLRDVASALDYAHDHGVVHRDVKPANVLLDADGHAKLADLGIATAAEVTSITKTGSVMGTASYMPPERLDGKPGDSASDIYAFATVAYETLSGRRARQGRSALEVAHMVMSEPPPDLSAHVPDAPPEAAQALARGMARDPAERQATAGQLVDELCEAFGDFADEAAAPPPAGAAGATGAAAGAVAAGAAAAAAASVPAADADSALAPAAEADAGPVHAADGDAAEASVAGTADAPAGETGAAGSLPAGAAEAPAGDTRAAGSPLAETGGAATGGTRRGEAVDTGRSAHDATGAAAATPTAGAVSRSSSDTKSGASTPTAGAPRSIYTRENRSPQTRAGGGGDRRWLVPVLGIAALLVAVGLILALAGGDDAENGGGTSTSESGDVRGESTSESSEEGGGAEGDAGGSQGGAPAEPAPGGGGGAGAGAAAGAPAQTVEDFYTRAAEGDFEGAWELAGPGAREQFGSFARFQNTLDTLESIEFPKLETTLQSGDAATVELQSVATHTNRVDRCSGTIQLTGSGDDYKIERLNVDCNQGTSGGGAPPSQTPGKGPAGGRPVE